MLKNVDIKKAAFGVALLFVAYKGYIKNSTAKTAAIAVGAVVLSGQVPVVNQFTA